MGYSEQEFIAMCKTRLEEKFSFGNGHGYSERDLDLLSRYMEEKKGVYISLSTLKRFWKNSYKHRPQLATLNALASALDYEDWQHFKLENKKRLTHDSLKRKGIPVRRWMVILGSLGAFALLGMWLLGSGHNRVSINGPVIFKADKTISRGVPNTVIFDYDVTNVEADSFFLQQSWNGWRRQALDPRKKVVTSIYYESGFHRAKLMANDSIIAEIPVHILSEGWEPHAYYDESEDRYVDFQGGSFISEGRLHLSGSLLSQKNIDTTRYFFSRISNSRQFGVSSDNFGFRTRVRSDRLVNGNCPWFLVLLVTEVHIFTVRMVRAGCENRADHKLGEIYRNGADTDLTKLGQDVYSWQEIELNVRDKFAELLINGEKAFTECFQEDFGEIMGITYLFEGTGSIDFVELANADGEVVFKDDFEQLGVEEALE